MKFTGLFSITITMVSGSANLEHGLSTFVDCIFVQCANNTIRQFDKLTDDFFKDLLDPLWMKHIFGK